MLKEKIDEILMQMSFLEDIPSDDIELKNDLGIDSLRMVELIILIEEPLRRSIRCRAEGHCFAPYL
jgi:acyl carrier protein